MKTYWFTFCQHGNRMQVMAKSYEAPSLEIALNILKSDFSPIEHLRVWENGKEIPIAPLPICLNCRYWRDKSWTDKGWGKCDNPKNEVKAGPLAMIRYYLKDDPQAAEELARHVEDGTRYPEDFGCIFFEPSNFAG